MKGILSSQEYTYRTCYARLGVFLTAFARRKLSEVIEPYVDTIHYVNTDGFVSDVKVPLKLSENLGGWKIENEGACEIIHAKKKRFL